VGWYFFIALGIEYIGKLWGAGWHAMKLLVVLLLVKTLSEMILGYSLTLSFPVNVIFHSCFGSLSRGYLFYLLMFELRLRKTTGTWKTPLDFTVLLCRASN